MWLCQHSLWKISLLGYQQIQIRFCLSHTLQSGFSMPVVFWILNIRQFCSGWIPALEHLYHNSEIRQHLTKICPIKNIIGKRDWFKEVHSFKICFSKHFYIGKMGSCLDLCIMGRCPELQLQLSWVELALISANIPTHTNLTTNEPAISLHKLSYLELL